MLQNLYIKGFRSFRELRVNPLTRVNLIVGTNNVGKTSLLEAAEILAAGTLAGLLRSPARREERVFPDGEETRIPELDVSHLFYGHVLRIGDSFRIEAGPQSWVQCDIVEIGDDVVEQSQPLAQSEPVLALSFGSNDEKRLLSISPFGGVSDLIRRRGSQSTSFETSSRVNFLGTESTDPFFLSRQWDSIVLTPEEEGVVSALQIVEPSIERIAFAGELRGSRGILLKLADSEQRLPLGTAGDGLKRLLALALNLFTARGGYLLIDEIDTGLHYTVMADMWRLVIETAKRLEVQVLATTHSLDCVRALAWVREKSPESGQDVTLHRVDRELTHTVAYTLDELSVAARNYLEVR